MWDLQSLDLHAPQNASVAGVTPVVRRYICPPILGHRKQEIRPRVSSPLLLAPLFRSYSISTLWEVASNGSCRRGPRVCSELAGGSFANPRAWLARLNCMYAQGFISRSTSFRVVRKYWDKSWLSLQQAERIFSLHVFGNDGKLVSEWFVETWSVVNMMLCLRWILAPSRIFPRMYHN